MFPFFCYYNHMKNYFLNEAVEFTCDILDIPAPKIKTSMLPQDLGKPARYYIDKDKGTFFIDVDLFTDARQFYFVIFHELFHHFQAFKTGRYKQFYSYRSLEYSQTHVKYWDSELGEYKPNGVEGYDDQYLELDANAFGMYMMKILWGLDVPVNTNVVDIKKLKKCIDEIKKAIPAGYVVGIAKEYDWIF